MRRAGIRRAKNSVRRKASSMLVAAKVVMLAVTTARYRFTKDSNFPCCKPDRKNDVPNATHPPDSFLSTCSTVASVANRLQESAREFGDSIRLPPPDSLSGNQLSAHAQRDCPGRNEAESGALIHSARGNHWDVGEHRLEIFDVTVAANVTARHNFDEIGPQLPRGDDARRGQCSWDHDNVLLHGKLHGLWIKAVTGKELGPGIETAPGGLDIVDAPGANNHLGSVLHDLRNYFDRLGHGQRDFEDGYSAAGDCLGGEKRVLRRRHTNGGNDPEVFDPAPYVLLVQRSGSLGNPCNGRRWTLNESEPTNLTVQSGQRPGTHRLAQLLQSEQV